MGITDPGADPIHLLRAGNSLARANERRAAWAAWQRAIELRHPDREIIERLQTHVTADGSDYRAWYREATAAIETFAGCRAKRSIELLVPAEI